MDLTDPTVHSDKTNLDEMDLIVLSSSRDETRADRSSRCEINKDDESMRPNITLLLLTIKDLARPLIQLRLLVMQSTSSKERGERG
jgi:hypothetical protein